MTVEFENYKRTQAKAWLVQVEKTAANVDALKALIDARREQIDGVRAIDYADNHISQPPSDMFVELITHMQLDVSEFTVKLSALLEMESEAYAAIEKLESEKHKAVLLRRYILRQPWQVIQSEMHYGSTAVKQLHRQALAEVYEFMPAKYRDPRPPAI